MPSVRANIKLAISGGQNEPRDAILRTIWALLTHPDQLALVREGRAKWLDAFEEYARWIAPIGMSPRRGSQTLVLWWADFEPEDRVFSCSARQSDETCFADPISSTSPAILRRASPSRRPALLRRRFCFRGMRRPPMCGQLSHRGGSIRLRRAACGMGLLGRR